MKLIDLNADMGEGAEFDDELIKIISSASIACGAHGGDENLMRKTIKNVKKNNVVCGAHPGFFDKENFGRKRLFLPKNILQRQIRDQLEIIKSIADEENYEIKYVKLHGALANMCSEDEDLSLLVFTQIANFDENLAILALDKSAQITAAKKLNLKIIKEAYCDRRYDKNGLLLDRSRKNAVINNIDEAASQAVRIAKRGEIVSHDNIILKTDAQSICLHSDNPNSLLMARQINKALKKEKIKIISPLHS